MTQNNAKELTLLDMCCIYEILECSKALAARGCCVPVNHTFKEWMIFCFKFTLRSKL